MNDPILQGADDDSISHLEMLIELSLDDMLNEDQLAELEALIASDPEAKNELQQAQRLHADLLNLFTTLPMPSVPEPAPAK